jgi:RNA-binding protein
VLTGKQRRHLRALGHELKVVVHVGKDGIDDGLVAAVDQALTDHELIKVKVGDSAGLDRHEAAAAIATRTRSEVAQVLGYTVLLYRPHPEEPKLVLPKAGARSANDNVPVDGDDGDDDNDDEG